MKKGFVRKLTAVLAIALLSSTITSDYNSLGVRAEVDETPAIEAQVGDLPADEKAEDIEKNLTDSADVADQEVKDEEKAEGDVEQPADPTEDSTEQKDDTSDEPAVEAPAAPAEEQPAEDVKEDKAAEDVADNLDNTDVDKAAEQNDADKAAAPEEEDSADKVEKNADAAVPSDGNAGDPMDTEPEVSDGDANTPAAGDAAEPETNEISITYSASAGGNVSMLGRWVRSYTFKLTKPEVATANPYSGYYLYNWTDKDGNVVCTTKNFKATGDLFVDGAEYTANFRKIDTKEFAFYILKPGQKLLQPQPKDKHSDEKVYYSPDGVEWLGTIKTPLASLVDDEKKNNYYSFYNEEEKEYKNLDGTYSTLVRDNVDYENTPSSTIESINKYLAKTYPTIENTEVLTEKNVVWYVYKLEVDGYHIDGYVSARVTYNSNYPADCDKENASPVVRGMRVNNTKYSVEDIKFDAPEGYFFDGWYMTPDCKGERIDVGHTYDNITYNVNLYAKWVKRTKIKIAITPDTDGQGPITRVYYNGTEQTANMNVHITTVVEKNKPEKNESGESDEDARSGIIPPQTISVDIGAENPIDVTVSGLKVTGGRGTDVVDEEHQKIDENGERYYPIILDMSGVTANVDGVEGNIKDWFSFETEVDLNGNSTTKTTVDTEKNADGDTADTKEIGRLYVMPRKVELVSASAEKVYDGSPLTAETVTENGIADPGKDNGGFVGTDGVEKYSNFASQTEVGERENTFDYQLNSTTKLSNYEIQQRYGTLKVTSSTEGNPPEDPKDPENPPKKNKKKNNKKTESPKKNDDNGGNNDQVSNNTPNPEAPAVLGAMRPLNGTNEEPAVLGAARSANTEDTTNTARVFVLMGAAAAIAILLIISRKKKEE
ncbi:hypothetical protein [Butyrivibrio sp. FC2001]|uniref:hypothetical protein n=1 Tax=Butyrivibrio sp. FC2001 TaxID=1280671 RepID=UPI000429BF1C|nr:hypothetical protein [Butyrivibrio sp. FC2001]